MSSIGSPKRISPSPKKKGRRSATPPAKRVVVDIHAEELPFRPAPLTPVGWDVDAAQAKGQHHPSTRSPNAMPVDEHGKTNADYRWELKQAKKEAARIRKNRRSGKDGGKGQGKGGKASKGKGQGKGQAKGKPVGVAKVKAKDKGKQKGGKSGRIVTFRPGKGATGGGKNSKTK